MVSDKIGHEEKGDEKKTEASTDNETQEKVGENQMQRPVVKDEKEQTLKDESELKGAAKGTEGDDGKLEDIPAENARVEDEKNNDAGKKEKEKKKKCSSGVVYISRIPPGMDVNGLRSLIGKVGSINRVWLRPESEESLNSRRELGSSRRRGEFEDGWIEFVRRKDAKRAVQLLNGRAMRGGKREGRWANDLWCLRYLRGFEWKDLIEETVGGGKGAGRERVLKLREEVGAARRERGYVEEKVEMSRRMRKRGEKGQVNRQFSQRGVLRGREWEMDEEEWKAAKATENVEREIEGEAARGMDKQLMGSHSPIMSSFSCFVSSSPISYPSIPSFSRALNTVKPHLRPRTVRACTSVPTPPTPKSPPISLARIIPNLFPFSRPHTIYGSCISVSSITLIAFLLYPSSLPSALSSFLIALFPSLLINIYITGLNQLFDIPIDRINKPYLPLPAGSITVPDATFIILFALLSSVLFLFSPLASTSLVAVILGSAILGTLYSMPPFRLKRFALLASIAILSVRGFLVNIGFYLHAAPGKPLHPLVLFATGFFTLFGIVIALMKDIPDVGGDRLYGIRTFSVRVGARTIFNFCVRLLLVMFITAGGVYGVLAKSLFGTLVAFAHWIVAVVLWRRSREVDPDKGDGAVYKYYMFAWKVFYLEYLLLPVAAL